MTRQFHRLLPCLVALSCLSGCDGLTFWPKPAPVLSKEAIATRDAPPELVFQGTLAGAPVSLIVNDCEVYSVTRGPGEEVQWTSLVKPDFYPFFNFCVRQSLTFESGAVTAELGRQAFGAGGCCATGGTYRSVDGRNWKKM
ncbi:MAG: hypothetical protein EOO28_31050 [Comamonadaceae bacterium]|nr:MAG: hypothetical protein EOO28_31050 [Comamonadaceae bacterium]